MRQELKQEIKRKIVHFLAGIILVEFALLAHGVGKQTILLILAFALIAILEIEFVRIELKQKIPLVQDLWRKKEINRLGGEVYFLIGGIISIALFDTNIAIACILMTTLGDSAAAIIGRVFGKHWLRYPKNKAWEGIIAEFLVNLIIGIFTLPHFLITIVMALTATLVETFSLRLDDNLMIPLFAGFNAQILFFLLQTFRLL